MLSISPGNPQPLYQQVVEQIRARILTGDLPAGTPLPSVRQLAADISASVITTRRAYLELEKEGLIITKPGLGTFVAQLTDEHRQQMALAILRDELAALVARAEALGVSGEELSHLLGDIIGRPLRDTGDKRRGGMGRC